jgi:hypothetical protein
MKQDQEEGIRHGHTTKSYKIYIQTGISRMQPHGRNAGGHIERILRGELAGFEWRISYRLDLLFSVEDG